MPDDELVSQVCAIVSLGGDGTMVGALRLTVGHEVPVLGVNHGNLGLLPGDAVVVATPTGSTAYSCAAGGPVLSPSASTSAIVVAPMSPMSGINRSVVLGADDEVVRHTHVDGGAWTSRPTG